METSTPDRTEHELGLLTTAQAAKLLGISTQGLHWKRWAKRGPAFVRMGRTVRYRKADLLAYVERCLEAGNTTPDAEPAKPAVARKPARKKGR